MTSLSLKLPMVLSLTSNDVQVSGPSCRYLDRVMLSAVGGASMRGIDRVLAVLLLLGAVGGAAAFARQSGSESASPGVDLAAPPLQHVAAPGTFFIAPKLVRPVRVPPARPVTTPQATPRPSARAVQPRSRP